MFLVHVEDNTIYVVFQDLTEESRDISAFISRELNCHKNIPLSLHNRIKSFFNENTKLNSNLERQKDYVSTLKIYIDIATEKQSKKVYYLNLFVLPKEIKITKNYEKCQCISKENIEKIERLSLRIFQLYNTQIEKKDIEFKSLKEFKGKSFLELELSFYEKELYRLHDHLLNYNRSLKDKVICSDKTVGIPLMDLNQLEGNPLKRYQLVKVAHQNDLIVFIYSLIIFLYEQRINNFKDEKLYKKLKTITEKIYNSLKKIATSRNLKYQTIKPSELKQFFARYKNSPEIQKNRRIYEILENIFSNQLKDGVFLSKSIDMTKMFETIIEKRLSKQYGKRLFVGDESSKRIKGDELYGPKLNKINFILEGNKNKQYPDYLILSGGRYHVLDAKYKLESTLMKDSNAFRQILIYARLFNKEFTTDLNNMKKIRKVILYAEKTVIDLDDFDVEKMNLDESEIDILRPTKIFIENVFDSDIYLTGIHIFKK